MELLANAKTGSVVYCNGISDWIKADSIIAFPNGLYNENNKLYLATSRNTSLFRYDIQPDGSLKNRTTLSTINGMDNISPNGNELIISVHPDLLKFGLLSIIPTLYSPSRTIAYNVLTGETRTIFNDDGQTISGSSTGLVVGNSLYLGQVFGEFVLKVENFQN